MSNTVVHAINLSINNQVQPLAVNKEDVFFSWEVEGSMQSAYRIIVSSSSQLSESDCGDVWNSGKVYTSDSSFIPYDGSELKSNRRYWWKAILWDSEEHQGRTSDAAFFDIGLDQDDWCGKWIWKSQEVEINSFAYFRKEIEISEAISLAKVFVSAHNHFKLYINGTQIGGYVSPAPTHPTKSKYYLTYDITNLLHMGKNVICAIAHYIGGGGQNYVNGYPGFILQCEIINNNGEKTIIGTDETWSALDKTPYVDGTPFQQNRRISAIQRYDANIEAEGWLSYGFDDALGDKAVNSEINNEQWVMVPQAIPEGYIDELIYPIPVSIQKEGLQVFDAEKIISGWPVLDLKGFKNAVVSMRYSENLDSSGRVGHNVANEKSENYYDEYIMCGAEKESWSPDFSYKAFRYIEVTGYPEIISPENIKIASAHTGIEYQGYFGSSNTLFNDIFKACIQTQKNNILGQLVDCPHREQAQYLADSDLHAETLSYYFSSRNILIKLLRDFSDAQLDEGTFPFVFPSNLDNPRYNIMIPEWDLHFCTLVWKIYYLFGDKSVLEKYYPTAKRMLSYYLNTIDQGLGLIPKSKDRWHISDWPYPTITQDGDYLTVQNIKVFHDLNIMSSIADILGKEEEETYYKGKAENLKKAIMTNLYNPVDKYFIDAYGCKNSHQGTNVLGYQYGLVPMGDKEALLDRIVKDGMQCKTLLSLNLFQVLFENGKGHEAYKMLDSTEFPGWGHMIGKGYKTIWEGFEDEDSHSHAWNAYPARLFAEYILGIKPTSPGFSTVDIKPFIPDDMDYAEGSITTVKGEIYVRWEKTDMGCMIDVKCPANTKARVQLNPRV